MFFDSNIFLTKWQGLPQKTRKKIATIFVYDGNPAILGIDDKAWEVYREIFEALEAEKEWLRNELIKAT